jgi:hypothetical protein
MKLIWDQTGDSLDIDVMHPELIEHWVQHLPSPHFKIKQDSIPYHAIDRLRTSIKNINQLLKSKFHISIFDYNEFKIDQDFLNQVHRDWATVQEKNANISGVLNLFKGDHLQEFYDINDTFHVIESNSKIKYVEAGSHTKFRHQIPGIKNPERFLFHGQCQLELEYWSIGRTDYEAWLMSDDVALIDNNSKLAFTFDVSLCKPYTAPFPTEYVKWMRDRGKEPLGPTLPIGNFKDYMDSVGDLYEVFIRNNKVDQTVTLEL